MKVIKINAVWCSGCLIMNKIWKKIEEQYYIDTINYDYDMDYEEVSNYNVGKIIPVFIFFDEENKEIKRVIGENSEKEMIKLIDSIGGIRK